MSKHARLSPSNTRWPNCAGSVREEANYPDIAGEEARDGTGSHILLEMCLQNNAQPEQYDHQVIGHGHEDQPLGWLVQPDRIDRVSMCLNYISRRENELKEQYPDAVITVESESKANPGQLFGRDDWYGTADVTITCRRKDNNLVHFIEVVDYKDGRIWVDADNNTQLISYLIGKMAPYIGTGPNFIRPFKIMNVAGCRMTVVQPRTNPPVRYTDVTPSAALKKADKMSTAAYASDLPEAPIVPGKHCLWCKANPKSGGHCTAALNESIEVINNMSGETADIFSYMSDAVKDIKSLSIEKLSELADAEGAILAAFDVIKQELKSRLETGVIIPGYTIGPGRSSKIWIDDEEELVKKLKAKRLKNDEIYPRKLATPAQILSCESLTDTQRKKIEKDMVKIKTGDMKIKKVAYEKPDTEQMFSDVSNEPVQLTLSDNTKISFL